MSSAEAVEEAATKQLDQALDFDFDDADDGDAGGGAADDDGEDWAEWGLDDGDGTEVPPTPKTDLQKYGLGMDPALTAPPPTASKMVESIKEKVEAVDTKGTILERLIKEAKTDPDQESGYDNTSRV